MENSWPKEKLMLVNAAGIHHALHLLQDFVHLIGDLLVGTHCLMPQMWSITLFSFKMKSDLDFKISSGWSALLVYSVRSSIWSRCTKHWEWICDEFHPCGKKPPQVNISIYSMNRTTCCILHTCPLQSCHKEWPVWKTLSRLMKVEPYSTSKRLFSL